MMHRTTKYAWTAWPVAKLRECLSGGDAQHCLNLVEKLDTSLVFDVRYSADERHLVQHLRSGVSDIIEAQRRGVNNPDMSLATRPLTSLECSLRERTFGADGWMLKLAGASGPS